MVPNGWKKTILSDVSERVAVGLATSVTEAYVEHGIPLIRNTNIKKGYFDDTDMLYLREDFSSKHANKRVKAGDVITVHTGSNVGLSCVVPDAYDMAQTFTTLIVTPKKLELNASFLNYVLNSSYGEYQAIRLVVGGGKGNLNTSDFKNYPLLLPPIIEQRRIVKVLSTWDKAIRALESLIDNSKQQKKALVQQLLTGKKRLMDDKGKPYEGEWAKTTISKLISESRVKGTNGELAKKITVKLYGRGVVNKAEKRLGSSSTKYYKRKAGQFIYSKLDFLNGAFGIIPPHLDGYESTLDLPAFDFTQNVIPKWFIEFVSRDDFYTSNLGLANGGRKARRVNPKDLFQIKLLLPSLAEQKKIASVLCNADKEIDSLQKQLGVLKQEKNGLMQRLLSGKLRVNVEDEALA